LWARGKQWQQAAQQRLFATALAFARGHGMSDDRAAGQADQPTDARYRKPQSGFLLGILRKISLVLGRIRHRDGRAVEQLDPPTIPPPGFRHLLFEGLPDLPIELLRNLLWQSLPGLAIGTGIQAICRGAIGSSFSQVATDHFLTGAVFGEHLLDEQT
jgi:hypothetical protein